MEERVRCDRRRWCAGKASDYIRQCNLGPGDRAVVCCRVSRALQRSKTQAGQVAYLHAQMHQRGVCVVEAVEWVGTGCDPYWLGPAAAMAEAHGAVLVAESTDRFIRSPIYDKETQDMQARTMDLEYLMFIVGDAALMTILPPDATPKQVRAHQRRRGQWANDNRGGRPAAQTAGYKKHRRLELMPEVLELHDGGMSGRRIAAKCGLPETTVRRWLRGT